MFAEKLKTMKTLKFILIAVLLTAFMGCKKDNPNPSSDVWTMEVVGEDMWTRLSENMSLDPFVYNLDEQVFEGISYPLNLTVGDTMYIILNSTSPPSAMKFYKNGELIRSAMWDHTQEDYRYKMFKIEENDIVRVSY